MTNKKDEFTKIHIEMDYLLEDRKHFVEEMEKFKAILDAKIEQAQSVYDDKVSATEKSIKHIDAQLKVLAEQVPQKHTKTQRKVTLLNGDVVIKNASQSPQVEDKEALINWAVENEFTEYYKVEEVKKLNWKDLKASLEIVDGQVIHKETGLVMQYIAIEEKDEEIIIK